MYAIGYDLGSSSIKVALVNSKTGRKIATQQEPSQEMDIIAKNPNWAEQNPDTWWRHICIATQRIINNSGINAHKITSIGIAYQMHGLIIVDDEGSPLRDAIIWCDSRAVEIGNRAYRELGREWCTTHLYNAPGNFTASKLKWVMDNEPEIYNKTYKFMLPGDYIAYKLTGQFTTTKNGLSEGTLWDYKTNKVAVKLLKHYGLKDEHTPKIVENFVDQGRITKSASEQTGLPEGASLRYRSGDQPNNALSLNILKPGEVAATGGTSGVVYAVTEQKEFQEISKVNHFAHVNYKNDSPVIGRLLNINGCGIQYRWLKNNIRGVSYDEMNNEAALAPIGSEGLSVLPFGNGAERMFDNKIVGTHYCNINVNKHSNAHLFRATLEGIAFSFVYGIEILKKDNTQIDILRAGNDNLFRSEIFAITISTLIGQDIEIYNTTGSIGAARASTIVDGDFTEFTKNISTNDLVQTYQPQKNKAPYEAAYNIWKNQLEKITYN